jgi:hypothetical protein
LIGKRLKGGVVHRGLRTHWRSSLGLLVALCAAGLFSLAFSSSPASSFGCGYGACTGPGGANAGFSTIVTAQTVPPSGGTVTGSANGATATVVVPPWALRRGGEVVIGTGDPNTIPVGPGQTVIAAFSVYVIDPNSGENIPGPFLPPLLLTISDPSIESTDSLVVVTGPGEVIPVPGADLDAGLLDRLPVSAAANYALIRPTPPPPPTTTMMTTTSASPPITTAPAPFLPRPRDFRHRGRGRPARRHGR